MKTQSLQNFGMVTPGANVRVTPFSAYCFKGYSGSGAYSFFTGGISSTQNASFPNSDDQIIKINEIGFRGSHALSDFFIIQKNDETILKIPIYELDQKSFSVASGVLEESSFKRLINPIVINGTDNIKFSVSGMTGASVMYLRGIKYSKIAAFDYDERKNSALKKFDYTIAEYRSITASTANNLFNGGLSDALYSKQLPLGNKESFQLNAIEIRNESAALLTGEPATAASEAANTANKLKIVINSVEVLDLVDYSMQTYKLSLAAGTELYQKNNGLILPEPIIFPAGASVQVIYTAGARTKLPLATLFMLKGELIKEVS